MANMIIGGFKIKVAEPKRKKSSDEYIKVGRLVYGTVIEDSGTWKVQIDLDKNGTKEPIILNFTPRSYELEGRESVFLRKRDPEGRIIRIIRDRFKSRHFPGLSEQYVPFANNWIVKGYIVKDGISRLFDFKDLIGINGYVIVKTDYEE